MLIPEGKNEDLILDNLMSYVLFYYGSTNSLLTNYYCKQLLTDKLFFNI